jgi:hypothetical protein
MPILPVALFIAALAACQRFAIYFSTTRAFTVRRMPVFETRLVWGGAPPVDGRGV